MDVSSSLKNPRPQCCACKTPVLQAEQRKIAYHPDLLQTAVSCMLFTDRLSTNSANCTALLPAALSLFFTLLFWIPACIACCAECSCVVFTAGICNSCTTQQLTRGVNFPLDDTHWEDAGVICPLLEHYTLTGASGTRSLPVASQVPTLFGAASTAERAL